METVTYFIFLTLERGSPLIYNSFEAFGQIWTEARSVILKVLHLVLV